MEIRDCLIELLRLKAEDFKAQLVHSKVYSGPDFMLGFGEKCTETNCLYFHDAYKD